MRPRRYGCDYAYGIEHSERFPEQYRRIEHRFKMADIDWCEFCGYCHRPIMLCEMYNGRDDLNDKSTTVIGRLAKAAAIPAYAIGVSIYRPQDVQDEIDQLNRRILELTRKHPITQINAQLRVPYRSGVQEYKPEDWWELVAGRHSEHHQTCRPAQVTSRSVRERLANQQWVTWAQRKHGELWPSLQEPLLVPVWS